jgi:dienelactone hydrolase
MSPSFHRLSAIAAFLAGSIPAAAGEAPPREEEVRFTNDPVQLAGTLLLPQAKHPVPAVVFVHGAAYHERGDNRVEADYFARQGIAALIYDKRGCGASTGDWQKASQFDLAEDALAAVRLLRGWPEVDPRHIGLWGMSQGAGVIPLAAVRSADVAFLLPVSGCLSFDEQMYYYRANLFRLHGLPETLLDVANKASLVRSDLARRIREGQCPAPAAWREACAFDPFLDYRREWARVKQPVLAVYGALDQAVPVRESVLGLEQALTEGGNPDWTIVVYPGAGHTLEKTRTGDLFKPWEGYVPGFLERVTAWVLDRSSGGSHQGEGLIGELPETHWRFPASHYEPFGWLGGSPVQLSLFLLFLMVFGVVSVSLPAGSLLRRLRGRERSQTGPGAGTAWLAWALCVLNLVVLAGLVVLVLDVGDQRHPAYPPVLGWLPLGGSLSAALTVVLLVRAWRAGGGTRGARWRYRLLGLTAALFVPFLLYWDLLGIRF